MANGSRVNIRVTKIVSQGRGVVDPENFFGQCLSVTHGQWDASPSRPQSITALWLVPNYTAW